MQKAMSFNEVAIVSVLYMSKTEAINLFRTADVIKKSETL